MKKSKPKRDRLRILKEKAWSLMSEWVRKKERKCFTCGKAFWDEKLGEFGIKGLEAGHYHHNVLDFLEENIHAQCSRCNHYLSGNLAIYTLRMIDKYGLKRVYELEIEALEALKGEKRTEEDYKLLITQLKDKIHMLQ